MKKKIFFLAIVIFCLVILSFSINQTQQLLSKASPRKANIAINIQDIIGDITKEWSGFAQGGEEPPPMLKVAIPKIKELSPSYIRLDHIYDSYDILLKEADTFVYDFSRLDDTVDDILATGALPFFCLSYMPSVFTDSGSVIDPPKKWSDWQNLVKATIEHYSGKKTRNLSNVYYEVWNEPELPQFGSWKLNSSKDYRLLYYYAVLGSNQVINANPYFLGGPAIGSYYPDWIKNFISYLSQNNLRLDFFSLHRYTKKPYEYVTDSQNIRQILSAYPIYANIPIIYSEWGIESENTTLNNTNIAAAFSINAISKFYQKINLSFVFEIKDGPPPNGGKWGLLTHEKNSPSLSPKPRFLAFYTLSKLKGERLKISGEGTFISGIAAKSNQEIKILLSNYDIANKNIEDVPISIYGLKPASYDLNYYYILENNSGKYEIVTTDGSISKNFIMTPNSILLLELTPLAPIATFIPGKSGQPQDQALVLKNTVNPLIFTYPEFHLLPSGSISFDIKPFWGKEDNKSYIIFEIPYSTQNGIINKLFLAKQFSQGKSSLVFGLKETTEESVIYAPIDDWQNNIWHHLKLKWSPNLISLFIDNQTENTLEINKDIRNGKIMTFYPIDAAIDNLKIIIGENQLITRSFNGDVNN